MAGQDGVTFGLFFYATINGTNSTDLIDIDVRDYVNLGCPNSLTKLSQDDKSLVCPSLRTLYYAFFIVRKIKI